MIRKPRQRTGPSKPHGVYRRKEKGTPPQTFPGSFLNTDLFQKDPGIEEHRICPSIRFGAVPLLFYLLCNPVYLAVMDPSATLMTPGQFTASPAAA